MIIPLVIFAIIGILAIWFKNGKSMKGVHHQDIQKITAEGRIRWTQIVASTWIHGTGAWVLFAPTETGWMAGIWGVIAYAAGCGIPGLVFAAFGPYMASLTKGYSLVDWVRSRYGQWIYYPMLGLMTAFLFIFNCAELTGLLDAFDFLLSANPSGDNEVTDPNTLLWIPAVVVFVANSYAAIGGLEVSLVTDRVEGVFCCAFLGMCIWVIVELSSRLEAPLNTEMTVESGNAAITLILGVWINEMINQTQYQRIFSAKSAKHYRIGTVIGSLLIMAHITVFGLSGVIVKQLYDGNLMPASFNPSMSGTDSFFWGLWLSNDSEVLVYVTLAITCCIVCSTTDTLVNAYNSLLIKPLQRRNVNLKWTPLITLAFTLPAIGVASARLSVLSLFMTINILAVSTVPGLFLGLVKNWSSIYALTTTTITSIISVVVYGGILEGTVGGAFNQLLFPRGPYDTHTAIIFGMCLAISLIGTPIIAALHRKIDPAGYGKEWDYYQNDITSFDPLQVPADYLSKSLEEDVYYYTRSTSDDDTNQATRTLEGLEILVRGDEVLVTEYEYPDVYKRI